VTDPWPRFRFYGVRMRLQAWDAMEQLDHAWRLMNTGAIHNRTRRSLVNFGFAEFQKREGYIRGRLTPEGIEFRNHVYRERGRRTNLKLWGHRSWY
jgi:hypothetical protein